MTDRYKRIREALAMGPTPGPWLVCPTNSGVFVKSERVPGYLAEVRHCRTTQDVKADARLIAACDPDTIRELLDERDALAAENARLRADLMESDEIREKLGHLLTRTAAALKGEPPEGVWHSWHDLPEKAAQLVEALRGWWEARRPVGWTEDQHRSCPHVNLVTNAEKALADAMLKVKAREASND